MAPHFQENQNNNLSSEFISKQTKEKYKRQFQSLLSWAFFEVSGTSKWGEKMKDTLGVHEVQDKRKTKNESIRAHNQQCLKLSVDRQIKHDLYALWNWIAIQGLFQATMEYSKAFCFKSRKFNSTITKHIFFCFCNNKHLASNFFFPP